MQLNCLVPNNTWTLLKYEINVLRGFRVWQDKVRNGEGEIQGDLELD